jgi:beta-lactamase superfamily II metal-dependent hydrolase
VPYGQAGQYKIIVIDGGTTESGSAPVDHIETYYSKDATIERVICSHPDTGHASGLREILKSLGVENLWVHGLATFLIPAAKKTT